MRLLLPLALVVSTAFAASYPRKTAPNGFRFGGGPSDEPISTNTPNFPGGNVIVDALPGPVWSDFQPPFPTDTWWVGLGVGNQDAVLAGPFPFQTVTRNSGLEFGLSYKREFDGVSIIQHTQLDWNAGFAGLPDALDNRKITAWDTQVVCMQYFANGATMDTCLVHGAPYMTFVYSNAVLLLKSVKGEVTAFEWVIQGKKGKVTTFEGGTYLLYVIDGTIEALTLQTDGVTLTSKTPFTGTIRLAKMFEDSQEAILDAHSETYPVGVDMKYDVTGDVSTMTWNWEVVGDPNNLLVLCWPHHRKVLQAPNYVDIEYITIKGYMKGVRGSEWVQKHDLPIITWLPKNDPHPSCLNELEKTLESEVEDLFVREPGDFYFWGGAFARDANLATIADHLGRTDLTERVIEIVKQSLGFFFDPVHKPQAAYETLWGGMVNAQDLNYTRKTNKYDDIGIKAYYNDHHFLYGYWLFGAAVIGKHDPNWLAEHLDFFVQMSRDIANPSPLDPHYTVTRHMSWFEGHSWASGIANGAGPRDQESSGEAINGYYGLLLFADVIKNQALIDYTRFILAIELAGAKDYWHLYPKVNDPDTPYPEQEFRELVTVGNVQDTQAGAWLFWGAERIQVAAIQILPLTPFGVHNYDIPWMEQVLPYCNVELEDPNIGGAFKSVIYAAYAVVDPQTAFLGSRTLIDWGSGNSATNQLYFVATQPSTSDICTLGIETPEGLYIIQDVTSGKYVTTITDGILSAEVDAEVLATKFKLKFKPGGSSIFAESTDFFVTGLTEDGGPLKAIANVANSNEIFRWTQQPDGNYQLLAMVNQKSVNTEVGTGHLVNTGAVSNYKLILTDDTELPPPPPEGKLKNVASGSYVVSTQDDPTLRAIGNSGDATPWAFELTNGKADLYAIRNQNTGLVVAGDPAGNAPLVANKESAGAWETFELVPYQGAYIIIHAVSGHPVSQQADNTLIDNQSTVDDTALWNIE